MTRDADLYLGRDLHTGENVWLPAEQQFTGTHILGPPGMGKTNLQMHAYRQFCDRRDGSVWVFSNKGDLAPMCRDLAVRDGHASRLVLFDPGLPDVVVGYDPLKPNALPIADQAAQVREGILASWQQAELTRTPQLQWLLYLALYVAREREWTLECTPALLRPGSPLRRQVLPTIHDPKVREHAAYLDGLSHPQQEKLVAPAYARLERFTSHPLLRRILTQRARSLDVAELVGQRKIVLVNLEQYRPLDLEAVRFLGRLILNDLVRHIFARGPRQAPVYLIVDEAQVFVSRELCRLLEQGREMHTALLLAHHFLEQLELEEGDRRLLAGVLQCAMTKALTGQSFVPNYRAFMEHFFLDQWNPRAIKHQDRALETHYRETTRTSDTVSTNQSETTTRTKTRSASKTESADHQFALAWPRMVAKGSTVTRSHVEATGSVDGVGFGSVETAGVMIGASVLPDGTVIPSASDYTGSGSSEFTSHADTHTVADGRAVSTQRAVTEGRVPSVARRRGTGRTHGTGTTEGTGRTHGSGASVTTAPFQEIHQRYVPTNTQHWTLDEFLAVCTQASARLGVGEIVVKAPGAAATFVRVPLVECAPLGRNELARTLGRILAQPYYTPIALLEAQEKAAESGTHDEAPRPRPPRRPILDKTKKT